jgi:hypothetical protein
MDRLQLHQQKTRPRRPRVTPNPDRKTALAPQDQAATVFVWAVWALLFLALLVFVGKYGGRTPYIDEWLIVSRLTGDEPITLQWLWQPHLEHRLPIPKLTLLASLWVTGGDFRAGMILQVAVAAALTFAMIRAARKLRGWTSYADAFFPVAILQLAHCENYLWSWQLHHLLILGLVGTILLVVLRAGPQLRVKHGVIVAICLALLPLCGGPGLAFVLLFALWLAYAGIRRLRLAPARIHAPKGLCFISLSAIVLLVFVLDRYRLPAIGEFPGLRIVTETSLAFLTLSFGPSASSLGAFPGAAVAGLLAVTALLLAWSVWRAPPAGHLRILGLLLFFGASAALAVGVGWQRPGALVPYHGIYTVPILCSLYFAWGACARPPVAQFVHMGLFTLVTFFLWANTRDGLALAQDRRQKTLSLEQDIRAGIPLYSLLNRHSEVLWLHNDLHEFIASRMQMLRRAKYEPFTSLVDNPPFDEVPLPLEPAALHDMEWNGRTGTTKTNGGYVDFAPSQPIHVAGLRVKVSLRDPSRLAYFRMYWRTGDQDFSDRDHFERAISAHEPPLTIYLGKTLARLRIHPDFTPLEFQIDELTLLVPRDRAAGGQ